MYLHGDFTDDDCRVNSTPSCVMRLKSELWVKVDVSLCWPVFHRRLVGESADLHGHKQASHLADELSDKHLGKSLSWIWFQLLSFDLLPQHLCEGLIVQEASTHEVQRVSMHQSVLHDASFIFSV